MSLKKISAVLVAMLAMAVMVASSASAAVTTERAEWYTGASPGTTLVGDLGINLETVEHTDGLVHAIFSSTIGTTPIELTATGTKCIGCQITNKEVTGKAGAIAYGTGQVEFTGVTVKLPVGCTVASEKGVANTVLTRSLEIHGDWMDTNTANKHAFIQFRPTGEATVFAQFQLGNCGALNGPYNVTGTLFVESKKNTGEFGTSQEAESSKAINETAGGGLKLGANAASLTGTVKATLANGASFAIKP